MKIPEYESPVRGRPKGQPRSYVQYDDGLNPKQRMRKRRKDWYTELKSGLVCARCGFNHPAALQFHHLPGYEKKFDISQSITKIHKSIAEVVEEINKCEVLCANCHAIETYENKKVG